MLRYDPDRVTAVLTLLRTMFDPLALMGWLDKRTKYGEQPGEQTWQYTREFLARYDLAGHLDAVIAAFGQVGVPDEVDASVWLAEHMDQIP
jgi:hypothetical protein